MFDDVQDLKIDIQKGEDGSITKITAGDSTYSNIDEAAKGLAQKDAFIAQLKAENSEYRGQLKEREDTSSLLKKLQDSVERGEGDRSKYFNAEELDDPNPGAAGMSKEDVEAYAAKLLKDELDKRDAAQGEESREQKYENNFNNLRKELLEHYGSEGEAKKAYEAYRGSSSWSERSETLNIEETPDALKRTIQSITPKKEVVDYGLSTRNSFSQSSQAGEGHDYSYYKDMMIKEPKKYFDVKTQVEIKQRYASDENFRNQVNRAAQQ